MVNENKKEKKTKKNKADDVEKAQSKKAVMKKTKTQVKKVKSLKKVVIPSRNIGLDVPAPDNTCTDPHCPFHGKLPVRGSIINGIVSSTSMQRSAVVSKTHLHYLKKYQRYEKRTSRYIVHNPECINAQVGDLVKIAECRPISKNKSFVIVKKGGW